MKKKKGADRSLLKTEKPVVTISIPAADGTSQLQRKDGTFLMPCNSARACLTLQFKDDAARLRIFLLCG